MSGSPRTLPGTGDHRSSCSVFEVFLSAGRCPGEVPVLLLCISPWDDRQGTGSCSTPMCSVRTGLPAPKVPPFQVRCIGRLSFRSVLLPCHEDRQKIFLSKARKARNVRQGHFLQYIHIPHGDTHNAGTLHSHTLFSLFPAISSTEHGERSRVRAEKPHSEAAQDFFRAELAKPLTASECGVTFADRKEKKHCSLTLLVKGCPVQI